MKYVSLFAGIGGFDLALNRLGHTCVYVNEWDKNAADTYERNFGHRPDTRDITTVTTDEIPEHDLLVGGFPCQAFSHAGHRAGFNETRGTLFFDVARILRDKRPGYFILENVKGLLIHERGETFTTILRVLTKLGYCVQWHVFNSKNFGLPQSRERVYIVGNLREKRRPEILSICNTDTRENEESVPMFSRNSIKPLWRITDSESARRAILHNRKLRYFTEKEYARIQGFPDNWFDGCKWSQAHKQAGNAVSVNVIYEIAKRLE